MAFLAIGSALFFTYLASDHFANYLELSWDDKVDTHPQGWTWFIWSAVAFVVNMVACYTVAIFIGGKLCGWGLGKSYDVFIKGHYPEHWLKDHKDAA